MGQEVITVGGIDPGLTGGWARIQFVPGEECPLGLWVGNFPLIRTEKPNKRRPRTGAEQSKTRVERSYDLEAMCELFSNNFTTTPVFVERVNAFPGQGVATSFKFGLVYGQILGLCAAVGAVVESIQPKAWVGEMVGKDRKDKRANLVAALDMTRSWGWVNGLNEGTADAVLIAEYGRKRIEARIRGGV